MYLAIGNIEICKHKHVDTQAHILTHIFNNFNLPTLPLYSDGVQETFLLLFFF